MSDATATMATTQRGRSVVRSLSAGSWGLFGLFGTLFAFAIAPAADPDLGWHLSAGRWMVDNRRFPFTDPLSWSVPGRKWIAHEWLSELVMYLLQVIGGDPLLIIVWAAIITASWVLLFRTARVLGATPLGAATFSAIGAISSVHTWGVRPQMLTLLLVVITGFRLHRWRIDHARVPWELIPLTAVWANLHGGYIFGIVVVLIFAIGALGERVLQRWPVTRGRFTVTSPRQLLQVWLLCAGCVLASLGTPNTIDGLIYPFTYLGDNASTRYVGEWFAPDFTRVQFWPFAVLLISCVAVLLLGLRHRLIGLTELGLTIPFALMGLQSMRNITQFVVCAVPVIASVFALRPRTSPAPTPQTRRSPVAQFTSTQHVLFAAALATTCVLAFSALTVNDLSAAGNQAGRNIVAPPAATQWLIEHPETRVLNHYNYGGWLSWAKIPVYVDGRPDMYGDAFMDEYVRLTAPAAVKNWQREIESIGATAVLMPNHASLAKQISSDIAAGKAPGWSEPTNDQLARLFVKR
jgi:hypothetical protein